MANPEQYKVQAIAKTILEGSSALSGVTVRHWTVDGDTVTHGNRITVKADPATPIVTPSRPDKRAPVFQTTLTVEMQTDAAESTFNDWSTAIDAAIKPANGTAYPAAAVTLAGHATNGFPLGIVIGDSLGGAVMEGNGARRTFTRTYTVVFQT